MIDWVLIFISSAMALAAAYAFSLHFSHELHSGTPTFCLYLSVAVQFVILPPITMFAWSDGVEATGSTAAWLSGPWTAGSHVWEHHFVVALVASMAKDMPWLFKHRHEPPHMGDMLIAHHVGCVALMLWGLAIEPDAFSMFIIGTMALELGSGSDSLAELNPRSATVVWSYFALMTAGNVMGVAIMIWMLANTPWTLWLIATVGVGLVTIFIRQQVAIEMRDRFQQTGSAI